MTLHDDCKQGIADCGGIPALLPLLAVKEDTVRWTARQVLLIPRLTRQITSPADLNCPVIDPFSRTSTGLKHPEASQSPMPAASRWTALPTLQGPFKSVSACGRSKLAVMSY